MKLLTSLLRHPAVFLLASLLFVSSAHAATLISSVNRNSINSGQIINLTVRYDKKVSRSDLNLNPLRDDFEILSNRANPSSSMSIRNGQVDKRESTVWTITLAAKREGELTIPAFEINGDQSSAITIQVQDLVSSSNTEKEFSAIASTDNQSAYESQQILLEIELSAAQGLSGLSRSEIKIPGAQVNELGQRNEQRVDNGIVRNIFILSYVVFPDRTGTLRIPAFSFTAAKNYGREQVIARSTAFDIEVKPKDTTHSPWFAASAVQIISQWSGDTNSIIAGEPITRTLTIQTLGQQASAIPPLDHPLENGYKSYKDQAQLDTKLTTKGYVSTRVESEAIVVSTPGTLTLPAISLKWWDVNKGIWQEATVAEQTLTVLPSTKSNDQLPPVSLGASDIPQTLNTQRVEHKTHWLWPVICAALLLICLVQAYFLWVLYNRSNVSLNNSNNDRGGSENSAWSTLNKSFKSNDAKNIRQALGRWAQTLSPDQAYVSLNALANYSNDIELNKHLKHSITELEASLYKEQSSFDCATLKKNVTALRHTLKASAKKSDDKTLTPLYKN